MGGQGRGNKNSVFATAHLGIAPGVHSYGKGKMTVLKVSCVKFVQRKENNIQYIIRNTVVSKFHFFTE
jgi:hypothetical protein